MSPFDGRRPIIDNEVILFPEPDSPTIHNVSSLSTEKDIFRTAGNLPSAVRNFVSKFSIFSKLDMSTPTFYSQDIKTTYQLDQQPVLLLIRHRLTSPHHDS